MSPSSRLSLLGLVFLSLSVIYIPTAVSTSNDIPCAALSALLPSNVFYPNSSSYVLSVASYFSVAARLTPSCVIRPTSTADVAIIVKTLAKTYQNHLRALFAIRGGGQAPNIAAASITQGITVDMRAIKAISVNEDGSVTSVGAGALWNDIYSVLDVRNLTVVGGRAAGVGVGGLISGGGLSFFSPEKGFACDNVVNMEVILASGQIVNASQKSHPDLFAALKGGSNNFGVVTRFDLKSFPQKTFWGGAIAYPDSADVYQLQAFADFMDAANFDPFAEIEQSFLYIGATKTFQSENNMFYTKPRVNPPALKRFAVIQPQLTNSMRLSNMSSFVQEIASVQPVNQQFEILAPCKCIMNPSTYPPRRSIYATITFRSSAVFLARVHELWNSSVTSVLQVKGMVSVLTFQRIPAAVAGNSMGLDVPSYGLRSDSLVLCLLAPFWADETDSPAMIAVAKTLLASIEKEAKAQGLYHDYQYLNYAASFQDPIGSYGPTAKTLLKAVSRKYDPHGLFQTGVPGGFKIWK